jgi:hypothetical protein
MAIQRTTGRIEVDAPAGNAPGEMSNTPRVLGFQNGKFRNFFGAASTSIGLHPDMLVQRKVQESRATYPYFWLIEKYLLRNQLVFSLLHA